MKTFDPILNFLEKQITKTVLIHSAQKDSRLVELRKSSLSQQNADFLVEFSIQIFMSLKLCDGDNFEAQLGKMLPNTQQGRKQLSKAGQVSNFCFIKIRSKLSSILLLHLLRIFMKKTLLTRPALDSYLRLVQ